MHLKNGNRLVCKKNCSNVFIKDKSYFVSLISQNDMVVRGIGKLMYGYISEEGEWKFLIGSNNSIIYYMNDYFYTKKDIRKLKLEKINENR